MLGETINMTLYDNMKCSVAADRINALSIRFSNGKSSAEDLSEWVPLLGILKDASPDYKIVYGEGEKVFNRYLVKHHPSKEILEKYGPWENLDREKIVALKDDLLVSMKLNLVKDGYGILYHYTTLNNDTWLNVKKGDFEFTSEDENQLDSISTVNILMKDITGMITPNYVTGTLIAKRTFEVLPNSLRHKKLDGLIFRLRDVLSQSDMNDTLKWKKRLNYLDM